MMSGCGSLGIRKEGGAGSRAGMPISANVSLLKGVEGGFDCIHDLLIWVSICFLETGGFFWDDVACGVAFSSNNLFFALKVVGGVGSGCLGA